MFGRLSLLNFDIYYIKYGTKTDEKLLFVFVLFIYQRIYCIESKNYRKGWQ